MNVQDTIEKKLQAFFSPDHLEVINESHNHNVPPGSESHFKVVIVTDAFNEQRRIHRHRAINQLLADELQRHIHALALHTYTPAEWQRLAEGAPQSPRCRGGFHKG